MALRQLPRIEQLELAVLRLPDWHPEAMSGPVAKVHGYVIDHPDGAIVVDTGVGNGNEFVNEVYEPEQTPLDQALIAVGVDPDEVAAIVNTHLHFDHCGQNPMFYGADVPVFVQRVELDAVDRDELYTDATWALPPITQRRVLDGDLAIAEGVRILATPGHTAGHQSVVIESDEGCAVLAGQAVWHAREFVAEQATPSNVESEELHAAALDSIRRLKALAPLVVHFSHCAAYRPGELPPP